ncbi:MAG: ribonuclease R, partial [Chromatiales bacterium]
RSGITYRLGDPLKIRVAAVNIEDRKIDFVLAESREKQAGDKEAPSKSRKSRSRSRSRSEKSGERSGRKTSEKSGSRGKGRSRSKRRK